MISGTFISDIIVGQPLIITDPVGSVVCHPPEDQVFVDLADLSRPVELLKEASSMVIRFQFSQHSMQQKQMSPADVAVAVYNSLGDMCDIVYSEVNHSSWFMRLRITQMDKMAEKLQTHYVPQMERALNQELLHLVQNNIYLSGVVGVRSCTSRLLVTDSKNCDIAAAATATTASTTSAIVVDLQPESEWVIDTVGSNLQQIWTLPYVDWERTVSNDPREVNELLGMECALAMEFSELNAVLSFDGGYVQERHVLEQAEVITHKGFLMPINPYGINKVETSTLMKCSFEQTMEELNSAALFGGFDPIVGITESIMFGEKPNMGSNFNLSLYNKNGSIVVPAPDVRYNPVRKLVLNNELPMSSLPMASIGGFNPNMPYMDSKKPVRIVDKVVITSSDLSGISEFDEPASASNIAPIFSVETGGFNPHSFAPSYTSGYAKAHTIGDISPPSPKNNPTSPTMYNGNGNPTSPMYQPGLTSPMYQSNSPSYAFASNSPSVYPSYHNVEPSSPSFNPCSPTSYNPCSPTITPPVFALPSAVPSAGGRSLFKSTSPQSSSAVASQSITALESLTGRSSQVGTMLPVFNNHIPTHPHITGGISLSYNAETHSGRPVHASTTAIDTKWSFQAQNTSWNMQSAYSDVRFGTLAHPSNTHGLDLVSQCVTGPSTASSVCGLTVLPPHIITSSTVNVMSTAPVVVESKKRRFRPSSPSLQASQQPEKRFRPTSPPARLVLSTPTMAAPRVTSIVAPTHQVTAPSDGNKQAFHSILQTMNGAALTSQQQLLLQQLQSTFNV